MPRQLRVLMVEDSEDDMFFALNELKRGDFQVEHERVESLADLSSALDRQVWDVIICDHFLPGFTSFHALEVVKQRQFDIPFIILSGMIGEEVAVQAMKAGAHDYVLKGALGRLVPSIEREVREAANRRVGRQAEKALRRSQYDLQDFFENAPFGLHWAGPDGTILRVNKAELKMLELEAEDYLGHNLADFFVDRQAGDHLLERLQKREAVQDFETQLRGKNVVRDVAIDVNSLWDEDKFVRSRWFVRDITDRKKYERAVAFLGSIVRNSDDAIIGTNREGSILTWNEGATRMYGYTAEEATGRSVLFLVPPSSTEDPMENYRRILAGQTVERQESVRLRKDGKSIPVSLSRSPVKDNQGKIIGISAIERDITFERQEDDERLFLIQDLSRALANVKTLRGLLPICATCKKIRDDQGYWTKLESYISDHTQAEFTHGICPECQSQVQAELDTTIISKP
jgi:PAS domain S-box-containing protein